MKKIAFFVLALIAIVNADDDKTTEVWAKKYESDPATVQGCLDEVEITIEELQTSVQKMSEIKDDNINEETKQSIMKYINFLACMMEKTEMMVDEKFVVDKLVEDIQKDKELETIPPKEVLTECITTLNDASEMTRNDRIFGLMICIMDPQGGSRR